MINTVEKKYNLLNTSLFNFKVTKQDGTILWVPNDEANTDYQAIQEWIAAGGMVIDNAPSGTEADGGTVIDNGGSE